MELFHLFKALNRKKWIILACVLVAVVTAFLLTMNKKNQYKSSSQIATGYTNPDKIKINDEHFNTQQIDVKFNNLIENFSSSRVLDILSNHILLHDLEGGKSFKKLSPEKLNDASYRKIDLNKVKQALQVKVTASSLGKDTSTPVDNEIAELKNMYGYTVGWLNDNLQVSRYQRTDYVNITFVSESPTLSAYVVNEIIPVFSSYYNQSKKQSTDVSVASLDSIVKAKRAVLDEKIAAKSDYMTARNIVDVGMQGGNNLAQVSGFENQLAQEKGNQQSLIYKVQQLDNLYKEARARESKTVNKGFSAVNDSYVTLKKQYSDLNKEYIQKGSNDAELKKRLDDILSRMQKLDLQIEDSSKNNSASNDLSADAILQRKIELEGDLRASNEKIQQIQTNIAQLNSSLNGMAAKGADITKFDRDIQLADADYSAAKDRLNTAVSLNDNSNIFDQTMYGEPAYIPEPSHRGLIIGMAGAAALILSSIAIILLEFLDQSIKTPSQFQRLTHLPFLGAVNFIDIQHKNILENISRSAHEEKNRDNTFRELLRKLRFEIEDSGKRIFLVTSTEPGQGKTTLIQALAYSLSLGKKKVLIIDTNFCNNDLTKELAAKPVLEKFYVNGKPFSVDDVQGLISKTNVEGVDTIGCGEGDYTPSEILPKNHLLNYLNELLKVYDYIFLEGAPLNSYTDTRELIHYSDGLIAIFSSETSLSAIDKESIKFLREQNDKFIGAILNKVEAENLEM